MRWQRNSACTHTEVRQAGPPIMERVINLCYPLPPYRRQYSERKTHIHPSASLCARATYIVVDLEEPRSLRPTKGWPANGGNAASCIWTSDNSPSTHSGE